MSFPLGGGPNASLSQCPGNGRAVYQDESPNPQVPLARGQTTAISMAKELQELPGRDSDRGKWKRDVCLRSGPPISKPTSSSCLLTLLRQPVECQQLAPSSQSDRITVGGQSRPPTDSRRLVNVALKGTMHRGKKTMDTGMNRWNGYLP